MAIAGQLTAILIAWRYYAIELHLAVSLAVVGAAVAFNLVSIYAFPQTKRLSEGEALTALLFDTLQLSLLLFLTGGLNNPFALLILAPATIAATALQTRATAFIGLVTIALVTLIARFSLPLRSGGEVIEVPWIFGFGFWLAIVTGVIFLGVYARRVASEMQSMSRALLATQMALAREQKLTDLGGVIAAAAHELGTPLATIKLVSAEMIDDLADQPDLKADAALIREQADRCRDILRSMGRAGKDDLHMRSAPLSTVVRESAEPHIARGKTLIFTPVEPSPALRHQPVILRRPELIHGLRNLIQNAVDFASAEVWIDMEWDDSQVTVRIADDGVGFPAHLIGWIGDPFVRHRREGERDPRPSYDGMGLGLFIAKTLLERTGASLRFSNGTDPFLAEDERPERSGAVVEVVWRREAVEAKAADRIGENMPIQS
jgi:two-component system sensor histidine kinase RegB